MRLHLHSLKLICRQSEELVPFAEHVTFFHGTLGAGKSTIARLVDFCLGGDLEQTTAIQREFISAQLSLTVGEKQVLIERTKGENQVQVTWANANHDPSSVLVRAKGDGPPVLGDDVVNLSDLLFRLLGYPIIRVRKRTVDEDSPMIRLSFRDILKFCYLEQEELDSSFFRLNTPVLAAKSKNVLNFFTGYYSETLSTLQTQLDGLRSEQNAKREAAHRIQKFLAKFGFDSERQIEGELESVRIQAEHFEQWLASDRTNYFSQTHFVDEMRDRLRELSDQLQKEKEVVEDLDRRLEEQRELRAELMSMKFKSARADHAKIVLEASLFEHCPNCGEPISAHRSADPGSCYLCLQPIGERAQRGLTPTSIRTDLDARIADIDAALRRHEAARRRQTERVANVSQTKARLDQEVAELLEAYESDRLARTRDAERQLAELGERARFLKRVRDMPGAIAAMLDEADAISAELHRIERAIRAEQQRLSFADRNFTDLERNFLEALLAVQVPGVEPGDRVAFNRRTLIPEIWPAGDATQAYSFYTAGSGGKKTLITICFALALHRTASTNGMPVPTLLIIDSPLKNITPDVNPELVEAFYRYLYDVADRELRDWQIVLIDQKLVAPRGAVALEFRERFMTTGNPDFPPLISYYTGP